MRKKDEVGGLGLVLYKINLFPHLVNSGKFIVKCEMKYVLHSPGPSCEGPVHEAGSSRDDEHKQ